MRSKEQKALAAAFFQDRSPERHSLQFAILTQKNPIPADPKLAALEAAVTKAQAPIQEDFKLVELRQNMEYSTRQAADRRLTAAQDLTWALVNSPSFLFNR